MARLTTWISLAALVLAAPAFAQAPPPAVPGPAATPADYILLTVIMKHDQTKNLDEINKL